MELTEAQRDADLVKEVMKHEGWKVLVKKLAEKQEALRKGWLHASTPEQAETIRRKALGLIEFLHIVAFVINRGKGVKPDAHPPSPAVGEQGEIHGHEPN